MDEKVQRPAYAMKSSCLFPDGLHALQLALKRWELAEDGAAFQTATSVLQRVRLKEGPRAFVKVALCQEERRGAALLRWWNGEGAVRVLAQHEATVLLEYAGAGEDAGGGAEPNAYAARSLVAMAQAQAGASLNAVTEPNACTDVEHDAEACRIICAVAARLHRCARPDAPELPPLSLSFQALTMAASAQGGIFPELSSIAHSLLAVPQQVVALHGDLHHGNILDAGARGWLAIDPKGYQGDRGFDYANIFCNPEYHTATQPARFERRVTLVAAAAQMERQRLLSWIAAWAGLSAAWHAQDGSNADTALAVAELALAALTRHAR